MELLRLFGVLSATPRWHAYAENNRTKVGGSGGLAETLFSGVLSSDKHPVGLGCLSWPRPSRRGNHGGAGGVIGEVAEAVQRLLRRSRNCEA
jgi:hypothetical protein